MKLRSKHIEVLEIHDEYAYDVLVLKCKFFDKVIRDVNITIGFRSAFCAPVLQIGFPLNQDLKLTPLMRAQIEREIKGFCHRFGRKQIRDQQSKIHKVAIEAEEEFIKNESLGGITKVF